MDYALIAKKADLTSNWRNPPFEDALPSQSICLDDVLSAYCGSQILAAIIVSTSDGNKIGSWDLVKNANPLWLTRY